MEKENFKEKFVDMRKLEEAFCSECIGDNESEENVETFEASLMNLPDEDFFEYQEDFTNRMRSLYEEAEFEKLERYKPVFRLFTSVTLRRSQ